VYAFFYLPHACHFPQTFHPSPFDHHIIWRTI
jgi:hypothetical protein